MEYLIIIAIILVAGALAGMAFASGLKKQDTDGWSEFNGLKFKNFLKDKKHKQ